MNHLLAKTLAKNLEADFENLSQFERNFLDKKTGSILKIQTQLAQKTILERTQMVYPQGHTNGLRYLLAGVDSVWGQDSAAV